MVCPYCPLLELNLRFRFFIITVATLFIFLCCSTEPEINTDVLRDKTMVMCELGIGKSVTKQILYIQRIRYLVDVAFTDDSTIPFGVEGASVIVRGNGHEYVFADSGNGVYEYLMTDTTEVIEMGKLYELSITLLNGETMSSTTITPAVTFPDNQDTLFIRPDSVLSWWYDYDTPYPLTRTEPSFKDTLLFQLEENTILRSPTTSINSLRPNDLFWIPGLNRELYKYPIISDHSIFISTAVDSPFLFLESFSSQSTQIEFRLEHPHKFDYDRIMLDDNWPLDEAFLKQVSNIDNAYGIFTSGSVNVSKGIVVSVIP